MAIHETFTFEPGDEMKLACYNPIKTSFSAVVIAPDHFYFNFILFVSTGNSNFDFNQCSIFTESCF